MRRLLRHPDFRLLYLGRVLSMVGDRALWVALGIWAYDLTGSTGAAGAVYLALAAPALLAPLAGALVDRLPRRRLLIANDLLTGGAVLALLRVHDAGDAWLLYAVAVAYGLSMQVDAASKTALVAGMVAEEDLTKANGLLEAARSGVRIAGPLAGAALYATAGGAVVAIADAVTFGLAALALSRVRATEDRRSGRRLPDRAELTAGVRHMLGCPRIRPTVPLTIVAALAIGLSEITPLAVVTEGLGRDATFLGVLGMFGGVGAIAGGLVASRVIARLGEERVLRGGFGLVGVALLVQATATVITAIAATVVIGVGISCAVVALVTRIQRETPDELRGRTWSAFELLWAVPYTTAIAGGAMLVEAAGFLPLCLGGAAALLLAAARPIAGTPPPAASA